MVSAFWHGFYPVYYVFFFQFYIVEQVSGYLVSLGFFAYVEKQNTFIRQLVNFGTMSLFNFLGISFCLLTFDNMFNFAWNLRFIPTILIFVSYFALGHMLKLQKIAEKKRKELDKLIAKDTPDSNAEIKKEM